MVNDNREKVIIFDTTLRDGEQQPDIEYTPAQKIKIADLLERVGVNVIEAGYPAASEGEFNTVNTIAQNFADKPNTTVCGLASTVVEHVQAAGECLKPAASKRIHTYIGTSPKHRDALNKTKDEIVADAIAAVKCAKTYTDDVQFSAEDAIRTEREFLKEIFEATIEAGATTINVPDTVGRQRPKKIEELFVWLKDNVKGIENVTLAIHCHDDLGNASANSFAAIEAGARQAECTINGYGERAGNANLKNIVMNIDTYGEEIGVYTDIDQQHLIPMERLMSSVTKIPLSSNRPGGDNANSHKSGGHQSKMAKDRGTYEILDVREYGGKRKGFTISNLSGRAGVRTVVEGMGFEVSKEQVNAIYEGCMQIADETNKSLSRPQIKEIACREAGMWKLKNIFIESAGEQANANVTLSDVNGNERQETAQGDGPVNAAFTAIKEITGKDIQLKTYDITNMDTGSGSNGICTITCEFMGNAYNSRGISTNVDKAAAIAFIGIANQIEYNADQQTHKQPMVVNQ